MDNDDKLVLNTSHPFYQTIDLMFRQPWSPCVIAVSHTRLIGYGNGNQQDFTYNEYQDWNC